MLGGWLERHNWDIWDSYPIGSMYRIYGNIYHQYTPNVSIYTIHGSYGIWNQKSTETVLGTLRFNQKNIGHPFIHLMWPVSIVKPWFLKWPWQIRSQQWQLSLVLGHDVFVIYSKCFCFHLIWTDLNHHRWYHVVSLHAIILYHVHPYFWESYPCCSLKKLHISWWSFWTCLMSRVL